MVVGLTRPQSLKALAVAELRRRIVDGSVELGALLSENALAAELGVSKTPVREAFLQLQSDGLVDIQPQRGTFVFSLTRDEVLALSELRVTLEVAAIEAALTRNADALGDRLGAVVADMERALGAGDLRAYSHLDGAFHDAIVRSASNVFLESAYDIVTFRVQALRARLAHLTDLTDRSLEDHRELLRLVRLGDVERAKSVLRTHIETTGRAYLAVIEAHGPDIR